jgi:metal-sulfur cluster biosynthetic enzyme
MLHRRLSCKILLENHDPGIAVAGVSTLTRDGCTFAQTKEGTMRTSRVVAGAVVAVACVVAWSPAWAQNEAAENKAVEAAKAWLALVDAGRYLESWDALSPYFRGLVRRERWDAQLVNLRTPFGVVKSRTLAWKKYTTVLEYAPKGEYVVIMFKTVFENMPKGMKEQIETIVPMLQRDGSWRVSGYTIKPPEK